MSRELLRLPHGRFLRPALLSAAVLWLGTPLAQAACDAQSCNYDLQLSQPGFYIAQVNLPSGSSEGYWGLEVNTSSGGNTGGFNAGAILKENGDVPGFVGFYLGKAEAVKITGYEYTGKPQLTVRIERQDSNGNRTTAHGPRTVSVGQRDTTTVLQPGFYVANASSQSGDSRGRFGLELNGDQFTGGVNLGGWIDNFTGGNGEGFGAFYVASAQTVKLNLYFGQTYGSVGAGRLNLELYAQDSAGQRQAVWNSSQGSLSASVQDNSSGAPTSTPTPPAECTNCQPSAPPPSTGTGDTSAQTVLDSATGLMWQDDEHYRTGPWTASQEYCATLTLAGYSDWRLPTQDELAIAMTKFTTGGLPFQALGPDWCFVGATDQAGLAVAVNNQQGLTIGEKFNTTTTTTRNTRCVRTASTGQPAPQPKPNPPTPTPTPTPITPSAGEPTGFEGTVAAHNVWRTKVNVAGLTWSNAAASVAQGWANTLAGRGCEMEHNANRGKYGENIYWSQGFTPKPKDVVDSWGSEVKDYNYASNTCAAGKVCGHYTQVVWKDTKEVGCGKATCSGQQTIWVCNYAPPGNYTGKKPY